MFIEEFRERSGLQVSAEIAQEVETYPLSSDPEMALYRFVQEALANVHRHSGTKTASVLIKLTDRVIEASVADNGRGIPADVMKQIRETNGLAGGVGLAGMHERISYIGGQLQIHSDEHGTTVSALIPIDFRNASIYESDPKQSSADLGGHLRLGFSDKCGESGSAAEFASRGCFSALASWAFCSRGGPCQFLSDNGCKPRVPMQRFQLRIGLDF